MIEPVIEVIRPCEHGSSHGHRSWMDKRYCDGGSRVRYTRQEAIDRIAKAIEDFDGNANVDWGGLVGVGFDALLGETNV